MSLFRKSRKCGSQIVRRRITARPALETLEDRAVPAVLTVTGVGDTIAVDGAVTLREAISSINAGHAINADVTNSGTYGTSDLIKFAIAGAGVHTIKPASALPTISKTVGLDGYTQSGASVNNSTTGDNAVLKIVLDGSSAGSSTSGLTVSANGCTIRGLVVQNFTKFGIDITGGNNLITGNFIGTDVTGLAAKANNLVGVTLEGSNNLLGSVSPLGRNLISGNAIGVASTGGSNTIQNNLIGVDATGSKKLGNTTINVVLNSDENTLGNPGAGNVIGGSGSFGVTIQGSSNSIVANFVGVDTQGNNVGNAYAGIAFFTGASDNQIGGEIANGANRIAFNGGKTVSPYAACGIGSDADATGTGNRVIQNIIYSNNGLGVDLGMNGPTANDPGDTDTGFNNLQNAPTIMLASSDHNAITIVGTLNSMPNRGYVVELYHNPPNGGPQVLLGDLQVFSDANGVAPIYYVYPSPLTEGTITAIETLVDCSEFSQVRNESFPEGSSPNDNFVFEAYYDLLHRASDASGQKYFSDQLGLGISRSQVSATLMNTAEYRGVVVTDLFNRMLKRAPDTNALNGFAAMLAQGGTVEGLQSIILNSDEYFKVRSLSSNNNFVAGLYRDVFGRYGDAAGLAFFQTQLDSGAPRSTVVGEFTVSTEASQHAVDRIFQAILHRPADDGAKAYFGSQLKLGQISDGQLIGLLFNSDEFAAGL